jgi:beta-lactam-binding protein with PASTA domain
MPNLIGMPDRKARAALSHRGLTLQAVSVRPAPGPVGMVVEQRPAPGATVSAGTLVGLTLSGSQQPPPPPPSVGMPNLIGETRQEAFAVLTGQGLSSPAVTDRPSSEAAGVVIEQTPAPGAQVGAAAPIALVLSRGTTPPTTTPPDLSGHTLDEARHLAGSQGYAIGPVSWAFNNRPLGQICSQSLQTDAAGPSKTILVTASLGPWWWPLVAGGGLAGLAGAATLLLAALVLVRPGWDPALELEAGMVGAATAPDDAIGAWLEPGDAAIDGPLSITSSQTNARRPGDG